MSNLAVRGRLYPGNIYCALLPRALFSLCHSTMNKSPQGKLPVLCMAMCVASAKTCSGLLYKLPFCPASAFK